MTRDYKTNLIWTPELIDRVQALWEQRLPAKRIAQLVGRGATKNSIIGKAHREEWTRRNKSPTWRKKRKPHITPAAAKTRERPPARLEVAPPHPTPEPPPPPPAPLRTPPKPIPHPSPSVPIHHPSITHPSPAPRGIEDFVVPIGRRISLLDLGSGECKWPLNEPPRGAEYLFCGERQFAGSPYCEYHSRLAFAGTSRKADAGWRPAPVNF